jgi:hypothetical protein
MAGEAANGVPAKSWDPPESKKGIDKGKEEKEHCVPWIQLVKSAIHRIQHSQKMEKKWFPDAKLDLMHEINNKNRE